MTEATDILILLRGRKRFAALLVAALLALAPCRTAAAEDRPPDVFGAVTYYTLQKGDNLSAVAQRFGIGIGELKAANPRAAASPQAGRVLTLPTAHIVPDGAREGILLNLAERRLYYFPGGAEVVSFPVTIGKEGWETPTGVTKVVAKRANPTWHVPDSIRAEDPGLPAVVPPGPDNPLGQYALNLGWEGIRIHGTNNPASVGRQSSHSCIRLYPADIEKLYRMAPTGTKVTVVNEPVKAAWKGNALLLEVAPPNAGATYRAVTVGDARAVIMPKAPQAEIDWDTVGLAVKRRDGLPTVIGTRLQFSAYAAQAPRP